VTLDAKGLAAKFDKAAKELPKTNQYALSLGLQTAKRIVQGSMTAAGVPPGSRVARGKVNVRYTPPKGTGAGSTSILSMTGPAHLVDRDTKPHPIRPRQRGRRQRRALRLANGDFVAGAEHPGTRGKQFWEHSQPVIKREVPKVIATAHRGALARQFSG
jgi:hypothetical protein